MNVVSQAQIEQWDKSDPLGAKRLEFSLPKDVIYLDGNSLGAMPSVATEHAKHVLEQQWANDLITSWNKHKWIDLPLAVGEKIARLIGAASGQVICCDSTSINLFKVLSSAMALQKTRSVVLSLSGNFPTDLYMVEGLASVLGQDACKVKWVDEDILESALTTDVAVLMLTQVDFRSGRLLNMERLTNLAHQKGILVVWDLAHSAGALPIALDECQVDFAVGCGYKYLNGGPGAPAFLYVAKRHQKNVSQPLKGWMGHKRPFAFAGHYQPAEDINQYLCGTPNVISMSILEAALDVFADVNMHQLREKSVALSELFIALVQKEPQLNELSLASPIPAELRGSQLAFRHKYAHGICQALIKHGVIADFRAPDTLRFGFTPLYTRYQDIAKCVNILTNIISQKIYQHPEFNVQQKVT
ncbi:MAG: kynureninase [Paraglaciecola polaris]|uniref:kynureninase n=1 Tax=Paraglaciecola polaris TaxID=222814 RepID=UPI0030016FA7|tara:strand:+ start:17129 stop:18373 length:1245 start_codon:yes stop_codon:yes gene_type:complete